MRTFLAVLLGLSLLAACAPAPPLPPLAPVPSEAELADELLRRLGANAQAFHGVAGMAKVKVVTPERKVGATQVLFAEKPDRFRAETLSPFGTPVLLTATDGALLSVYAPGEGAFYQGEASLQNFQRFVPVPLRLADLVHIILYHPPLVPFLEKSAASLPGQGYRLHLAGDQGLRQELFFDLQLRLREARYYRGEELQLQILYDEFREASPPFPLRTEVEMPLFGARATIALSDIELNPVIPAERFTLSPPAGVDVKPIP